PQEIDIGISQYSDGKVQGTKSINHETKYIPRNWMHYRYLASTVVKFVESGKGEGLELEHLAMEGSYETSDGDDRGGARALYLFVCYLSHFSTIRSMVRV
ncbi:uncharacterized protein Bfra_009295, partial [Botrytis fragariae]